MKRDHQTEEVGNNKLVTFQGVLEARKIVYQYLRPTQLIEYPLLSSGLGCRAYVKHENHNPTGSFKIRGGLNLISRLSEEERARGVITATRGNHGQSIALASRIFGVRCIVAIPEGNNPEKNRAMEAYGAELLIHGSDFDEARVRVERLVESNRMRYIHSANEPLLVQGVATYASEVLEDLPSPDVIIVPLGGGSGVCGVLTVVRAVAPRTRVIAVQAENAPAFYLSWQQGQIVETPSADTIADGLATRVPFEMTLSIIERQIDEIITVSEDELAEGVFQAFQATHNVAEPAGAAALAGAYKLRESLQGKNVVIIMSGGNIVTSLFSEILQRYS